MQPEMPGKIQSEPKLLSQAGSSAEPRTAAGMPTLSCSSGHQGVPCLLLPAQHSLSWLVSVICPSVLAGDTTEMFPLTTLVKGMCLTDSSTLSRHHNCSGVLSMSSLVTGTGEIMPCP